MRQTHKFACVICFGVVALTRGYGQSLGDVARAQKQKQAIDTHASHKVITNEDLPENADARGDTSVSGDKYAHDPAPPASNDEHAAARWKAQIRAQKSKIASLQNQIERLNSSIRFVAADRYYNTVQHNERQVQKQDDVQRMQRELDAQKKQLEDMQEQARKAGLGSSVYEP
jgi:chromosome segregation ATPase